MPRTAPVDAALDGHSNHLALRADDRVILRGGGGGSGGASAEGNESKAEDGHEGEGGEFHVWRSFASLRCAAERRLLEKLALAGIAG